MCPKSRSGSVPRAAPAVKRRRATSLSLARSLGVRNLSRLCFSVFFLILVSKSSPLLRRRSRSASSRRRSPLSRPQQGQTSRPQRAPLPELWGPRQELRRRSVAAATASFFQLPLSLSSVSRLPLCLFPPLRALRASVRARGSRARERTARENGRESELPASRGGEKSGGKRV